MEAIESLLGGSLVEATRTALWVEPVKAAETPFTPPDLTGSQEWFCLEWHRAPTHPDGCGEPHLLGAFRTTDEANQGTSTEGRPNTHGARRTTRAEPAAVGRAVTQLDHRVLRGPRWARSERGLAPATELGASYDLSAGSP